MKEFFATLFRAWVKAPLVLSPSGLKSQMKRDKFYPRSKERGKFKECGKFIERGNLKEKENSRNLPSLSASTTKSFSTSTM